MKKIEIISDEHRHHVYVGNTDFWLDTLELVELYKKLGVSSVTRIFLHILLSVHWVQPVSHTVQISHIQVTGQMVLLHQT